jgi:hypothetical protein
MLFMVTRSSILQTTFADCFLDSDATDHMTSYRAWFITYKPLDPRDIVYLGDNYSHHQIHGKGKVAVRLMTDDVSIIQVYHVLALFHNVLSVRQIVAAGYIITFSKQLVTLENVEGWVFILEKVDHRGLYQVGSSSDELSNSMHKVLTPHLALSALTTTSDDSVF